MGSWEHLFWETSGLLERVALAGSRAKDDRGSTLRGSASKPDSASAPYRVNPKAVLWQWPCMQPLTLLTHQALPLYPLGSSHMAS